MAVSTVSDEALCAILAAHPDLRERFVSIAMAVVDSDGNLKEADAAEEQIVEETRELGCAAGLVREPSGGDGARHSSTAWDTPPR